MSSDAATTAQIPDLSDPLLYERGEALAVWRRLRREHPVCQVVRPGGVPFWAVLSYDLVVKVLSQPTVFSSTGGMRLDADETATAAGAGRMMVISDPPRHGKIRRIMGSAFTPRTVRRLEVNMRTTVTELLRGALAGGTCEFTEVAARLPLSVICDLLGVPRADWDFMLSRTMTAFGVGDRSGDTDAAAAAVAHTELFQYYDELMRERRRSPRDDIISALVHGTIDGEPLTSTEVVLNCNGLISGGNETTRHATLGGLLAFIENPDQWTLLRERPELLPGAVQEVLRYTSPAMHLLRTAAEDAEIGGERIRAGDRITLWLASANRDEQVFADPDVFDVSRTPNRHLTFAHGPHHCIGAALASTELTIMFEELTRRVERAELAGPVRRMRSNLIGGLESLPVSLTPANTSRTTEGRT
ncbi:cytochrome P450 [Streptomyces sp. N50]|uniref:cytochrome P450 n=1 Tax=Streptomyces sp. N50 TaxID=3081765 RepID=UPI0029624795|nr:cytochrome P450 [Streptomyces sp. N50]WOX17140.1 cytochrome P450 [Streptomyces sp. N50]